MRVRIANGMAIAALILILVYGGDIMSSIYFEKSFLPLDAKTRGMIIVMPAAALLIMAFFLARKTKSRLLGLSILITGILMMGGLLAATMFSDQSVSDLESFGKDITSFLSVVVLGMFIVILGLSKLSD